MLLEDTVMNELNGEVGKRLSQVSSGKVFPHLPRESSTSDKALPQLPRLLFNSDDAWAMASRPVVTSASTSTSADVMIFSDEEGEDSYPPPVSRFRGHERRSSAPPLPRKSSRRHRPPPERLGSTESGSASANDTEESDSQKTITTAQQNVGCPPIGNPGPTRLSLSAGPPNVGEQIERMLAASKALKPVEERVCGKSPPASKTYAGKGNKVLSKMKDVISGRILERSLTKRHKPPKADQLIGSDPVQVPDYDEEPSSISAMELRMNEGSFCAHVL